MQIVDVSEEPGQKMKVGCSIKLADQREGTDLDPTNTKYQPRGEGPAGGPGRGPSTAAAAVAKGYHHAQHARLPTRQAQGCIHPCNFVCKCAEAGNDVLWCNRRHSRLGIPESG